MMGMTTQLCATLHPGELTPVGAVADAFEFLASDKSLHITGTDTPVDQARTLSFSHCHCSDQHILPLMHQRQAKSVDACMCAGLGGWRGQYAIVSIAVDIAIIPTLAAWTTLERGC